MLVLIVIGLAVCVGFIAGGSLRPFERLRVHWWGVALAGLALQGISLTSGIGKPAGWAALVGSYGLLLAFAWVNRRLPASWLVMAGLVLNILVIGVNGGMPVSASALETAGAAPRVSSARARAKHHLMGPGDTLTALARRDRDPAARRRRDLDRRCAPLRGRRGPRGHDHARTVGRESPAAGSDLPGVPGEASPGGPPLLPSGGSIARSGPDPSALAHERLRLRGGSGWRSDFGNRTVIVAPSPGALSTSKRPPPTCARSRIIAMPK